MRRLLLALIALPLLTACIGVNMNDNDPDDKPTPTARSTVDGVEVWDLQAAPTATAFGISEDSISGIYETDEPRTVRFVFPGGTELTVDATLVSFERSGEGDAAHFYVGIRTAELEPDELVAAYRDVLEQLNVSTTAADQVAAEIAAAPDDQTERISVGSDAVTLGSLKLGAQAGMAPIAGSGRVIIGGSWQKG